MTTHGPDYRSIHHPSLGRRAARGGGTGFGLEDGVGGGRARVRCVGLLVACALVFAGLAAYDVWWQDDVEAALEARMAELVVAPQDRAVMRSLGW